MDFNIELQTENVLLRPIKVDDFDSFFDLTKDESMWIYYTSDLSIEGNLEKWIDDAITDGVEKKRLAFTIIDKKQNQIIGSTSFGNISHYDKRIEIGWTWIGKEFRGKGFNDQIKFLMIKYCFEELGFERVELKI